MVIGDHLEVRCSLLTLPKAMSISRSEILREKKEKRKKDEKMKSQGRSWEFNGINRINDRELGEPAMGVKFSGKKEKDQKMKSPGRSWEFNGRS